MPGSIYNHIRAAAFVLHSRARNTNPRKRRKLGCAHFKIGLRALQCVPGLIYNADRAAALIYAIRNYFTCAHHKHKKITKIGLRAFQCVPGSIYHVDRAAAFVYAIRDYFTCAYYQKYEIKLSCARFSVCLDHYITTFAQLRLYCIHVRATQTHEKDENWGARTSKIGLRALQCVPGLFYNADRAAAFVYTIRNYFKCAHYQQMRN